MPEPDQYEAGLGLVQRSRSFSVLVVMFLPRPQLSLPGPGWLSLSLSGQQPGWLAAHAYWRLFIDF